jgi:calcineurin-like phosphoesterase family protein
MPIAAFISDLHGGHPGAIWPDNFQTVKGNPILPNKYQYRLLEHWEDFWSDPDVKDAEYIVEMEESIEGYNRKRHGMDIMISDLNEQLRAMAFLLIPKISGRTVLVAKGNDYHGSQDTNVAETFARMIGGHYFGDMMYWNPKGTDKTIMLTHAPGDPMIYKSTILDRNSLFLSAIKTKLSKDPDAVIYGHLHQYFRFDTPSRINAICPCWKFWHPIKSAAKFPYTQPTIGGLIMKIPSYKGKIELRLKDYPLEHIYDAVIEK